MLVFHATGAGGRMMESIIESGVVDGVLDVTTTEWADELVGGVLNAGPTRLDAAARLGVPAVVAPGCLDMVNFGAPDTVPAKFAGRRFYPHNPQVTLMRTTPDECAALGRIIAEKVNRSTGPVTVLIPRRGVSVIGAAGKPFHDPAADEALFAAITRNLRGDIPVVDLDANVNDPAFAEACANRCSPTSKRCAGGQYNAGRSTSSLPPWRGRLPASDEMKTRARRLPTAGTMACTRMNGHMIRISICSLRCSHPRAVPRSRGRTNG